MDARLTLPAPEDGPRRLPLSDWAFENIVALITSGEVGPGSELNEAVLAERLSISRGPVREALRRLEGLRVVTREAYRRARVVPLGPSQMAEIYEFREGLEGMAARLAAERMPESAIAALEASLQEGRARSTKPAGLDLHWEVAKACGNARITEHLCSELYYILRLYRHRAGSLGLRSAEAHEEHWQIARAIRARDPDLAESLMRVHIRRAREHLVGLI